MRSARWFSQPAHRPAWALQKLLLPLGGEPLVRRTVRQVCEAGFDEVLVVVGSEHETCWRRSKACRSATRSIPTTRPAWAARSARPRSARRQRGGDVCAGRPTVRDRARLSAAARHLSRAWPGHRQRPLRRRHGAAASLRSGILPRARALEHGARPVLQRHRDRTIVLQFPPDLLLDVDTPETTSAPRPPVGGTREGCRRDPLRNPPSNPRRMRQNLPQYRHRDLLRRLRAERQTDRAAHSRRARGIRNVAACRAGRPASFS